MKYLILILLAFSFQSCSPSLQGGGWIAPAGLLVLSFIFLVRAFKKSLNLKVSVVKINESFFALVFFLIAVGVFIWMQSAK